MIDASDAETKRLAGKAHAYFAIHAAVHKLGGDGFAKALGKFGQGGIAESLGKAAKADAATRAQTVVAAFAAEVDALFFHELGLATTEGEIVNWRDRINKVSRRLFDDLCAARSDPKAHLIARALTA
ncbi:MAG: hypothetical protein HQL38_19000 [Alphaproteobacteria bacterium]|nr:hypothetical protein [Alphaproteobacteria bacterium]